MTKKQIEKFIKKRNASPFASNLQFAFDAHTCGFEPDDLGRPGKYTSKDGLEGWHWDTPHGKLIELAGKLMWESELKLAEKKSEEGIEEPYICDRCHHGYTLPTPNKDGLCETCAVIEA